MSQHGIRHDPKIIALAILSTLFPGGLIKKILEESDIKISDRTLRRTKQDLKDLGIDLLLQEMNKVYQFSILNSFIDNMKLKNSMFSIVESDDAENFEKIKAGELILKISASTPEIMDPLLSKAIREITDNTSKINLGDPLQEEENLNVGPCRTQPKPSTEVREGVDTNSTETNT